jgi:mannose-6-phosphate isomerase-like protein (cupin superfamily)
MGVGTAGAQPHFHRTISESFFVLDGSIELFTGEEWVAAAPGDFAYVPEGGVHGFRNVSGDRASLLILFAPGAPREAYFQGLVEMAAGRWKPTHEELVAFLEEHDNIYL